MDYYQSSHYQIFDSIARDDLIAVQYTLKRTPIVLESVDKYLNTPLLNACYLGRSQIVQYLLQLGADFERLNIFGKYDTVK